MRSRSAPRRLGPTRGYTFAAVLADEVAFWRSDESSANPDTEIMRALRPGLATIPGAMLLMASSPYAKRGELYNAYRRHYGKDDAKVLVWKAATLAMHPSLDKRIVDEAYENDPEAARAEYGGRVSRRSGRLRHPRGDRRGDHVGPYRAAAGAGRRLQRLLRSLGRGAGRHDLASAILSRGGVCVLDAAARGAAAVHPDEAIEACVALLRRYGVAKITGDKYAGEWPQRAVCRARDRVRAKRPAEERSLWRPVAVDQRRAGRAARSAALVGPALRPRAAHPPLRARTRSTMRRAAMTTWPMRSPAFWLASTSIAGSR